MKLELYMFETCPFCRKVINEIQKINKKLDILKQKDKVLYFDFNIAGTIGAEMENSKKTWVARSRVKAIKDFINSGN